MPDEYLCRKNKLFTPSELHQLHAMYVQMPEELYQIQIDEYKPIPQEKIITPLHSPQHLRAWFHYS